MFQAKASVLLLSLALFGASCQKKKLTEVVEVPLPTAEEKVHIGHPDEVVADPGAFEIYRIPFEYDALAPHIDAMTMEMHYSKHYLTYTNNLNRLLENTDLAKIPIDDIFKKLDMGNTDLRNNLGGYYNHTFFWKILTPKETKIPTDNALGQAIVKTFGSYENFKSQFDEAASRQFGSGWAWLVVNKTGKLQISSTPNQDNPLMPGAIVSGKPILALDVWEHAYYLGYQYKRKKYIEAFFNVINWDKVSENYDDAVRQIPR